MADNVAITAGAGTSIATDDVSGAHYQKVKLALGAADTANLLSVGAGDVDTGTPRVTLADDSPGVITLSQIDKGNSVPVTMALDQEAIGVVPRAHGVQPTAVAVGAPIFTISNRHGVPFFIGGHPNVTTTAFSIASATTDMALLAVATGLKAVVTQIWVRADKANSGNTSVQIGFGAANVPTSGSAGLIINEDLGAGDGHQIGNGAGIIAVGTDFQDLRLTCENPTAGAITVGFTYHTIES